MGRSTFVAVVWTFAFAATPSVSAVQTADMPRPPDMPVPTPEQAAQIKRIMERLSTAPDTPGTGSFPAIKEEASDLPDHTVYRPADLSRVRASSLPILVWGNGGCVADGAFSRLHLLEIASHGYLAIANGPIRSGPGRTPPANVMRKSTTPEQLTQAINWAIEENDREDSPYYRKLNVKAVAVSGTSCGGLQAIQIATSDNRVKTALIHNSGVFPEIGMKLPGINVTKSTLSRVHVPIIYILGGKTDIAYSNGVDDFARLSGVPAVLVNDLDAGHNGTFFDDNGGPGALIAVAWLDWVLKGDKRAAKMFKGRNCELCSDPNFSIERKGL